MLLRMPCERRSAQSELYVYLLVDLLPSEPHADLVCDLNDCADVSLSIKFCIT